MNRRLNQFRYSFERDVVEYFLKVTIGASGAPTLTRAKGVASITRDSAGQYTIVLQDRSAALLHVSNQAFSSTSPQAAPLMTVEADNVNSASKSVVVQFRAIDNSTVTDPASGEVLLIKIAVCNN